MKFNRCEYEAPNLGRTNSVQWPRLGTDCLGKPSAQRTGELWSAARWTWAKSVPSLQRRPTASWVGWFYRLCRSREEVIPVYSTHFRPHQVLASPQYKKDVDKLEQIQQRPTFCWRLEHHALGGNRPCSSQGRGGFGGCLVTACKYLRGLYMGNGARLFIVVHGGKARHNKQRVSHGV